MTSPPCPQALNRGTLRDFLLGEEESPIARTIAKQSQLPFSWQTSHPFDTGEHPRDDLTSRMVGQSYATTAGSLPHLDAQGSERTSPSVATDLGISAVNRQGRLLEENAHGELHLPLRSGSWSLPCPCSPLGCRTSYQSWQIEEWMIHTFTHFSTNETRARRIQPPKESSCQYCLKKFQDNDPATSWRNKMIHQTEHYKEGRSGLPDFELVLYLWKQGVISRHEFRDTWGPASNINPHHTRGEAPQEEAEDEKESHAYIQVHSRRERRRR